MEDQDDRILTESSLRSSESKQHLAPRSLHKIRPTPVTVTGVSIVSTGWLVATFLVIAGIVIAAGWPNWMKNHNPDQLGNLISKVDIGLYYFCYELQIDPDVYCNGDFSTVFDDFCCTTYEAFDPPFNLSIGKVRLNKAEVNDISFLLSASVIYAFAFLMLFISLVVGVIAYCKPRFTVTFRSSKEKISVFAIAFVFQAIASECDKPHNHISRLLHCERKAVM